MSLLDHIRNYCRRWVRPWRGTAAEETSAPKLIVLIAIVFAGFLAVIGLNPLFSALLDGLNQNLANERARLFIGEELLRGIKDIEIETFRLATTMGVAAQDRIEIRLQQRIDKLERDLAVLRDGGSVRQLLPANVEGAEEVVREATYRPAPGTTYVVELIELGPQIDQMRERLGELRTKIRLRDELRDQPDRDAFVAAEKAVKSYLKGLPTFFFRLNETASRHFVATGARVQEIEAELARRRQLYEAIETLLATLVVALVMAIGIVFVRQIALSNRKLHAARDAMQAAKDEAESASRAKSDFVSRMSHELRTPLNAILGFAQLLRGDRVAAPHRIYIEEIDKAGAHLLELINQVLDLAKIEAGRLELERVEFDPLRLLDEVTAVVAQHTHGKGLALCARVSSALPPLVIGDPTRLRQVLINLLANAIKFTEAGEIGLSAQPLDQGEKVLFRVWDTGPGIDPAVLGKLFQPFVQADNSTMRRFGGSGLGLMICKELVTAMGGKIEVDSQVGQGSCFWFAVPLARSPRPVPRPMPLAGHECIVACANRSLAESLTLHVEALGGVALVADSADAAAAALNRMPRPPRLVVVNLACRAVLDMPALRIGIDRLLVMPAGESSASTAPEAITVMHSPVTFTQLSDWIAATARPEAERRSGSEATAITPLVCGAEHRLLLVEDNPVNQLVASAMLERLSVSFECAGDGIEALDKLERTRFDLVLMDVEMPEMDGLTATRELRRREKEAGRCRVPVIAMTANALAQDRERCLEAGMDAHMGKPVRLEELGATIERWLAAADGERTAASRSDPASLRQEEAKGHSACVLS